MAELDETYPFPEPAEPKPENNSPLRWSITAFQPREDHDKIREIYAADNSALIGIVPDITGVTREIAHLHALGFSDKLSFDEFHQYPLVIAEMVDLLVKTEKGPGRLIRNREKNEFKIKYVEDTSSMSKFFTAIAADWDVCLSSAYEKDGPVIGSFDAVMKDYSQTTAGTCLHYREEIFAGCIAAIGCSEPAREIFNKLYAQKLPSTENWYWKVLVSEKEVAPLAWNGNTAAVQAIRDRRTAKSTADILESTVQLLSDIPEEDALLFIACIAARDKVPFTRKRLAGPELHQALKDMAAGFEPECLGGQSDAAEYDSRELQYQAELEK